MNAVPRRPSARTSCPAAASYSYSDSALWVRFLNVLGVSFCIRVSAPVIRDEACPKAGVAAFAWLLLFRASGVRASTARAFREEAHHPRTARMSRPAFARLFGEWSGLGLTLDSHQIIVELSCPLMPFVDYKRRQSWSGVAKQYLTCHAQLSGILSQQRAERRREGPTFLQARPRNASA